MDFEILCRNLPEPHCNDLSPCSACQQRFAIRTGLVLSSPLSDPWRMVEWRYCPGCAQGTYGALLALLKKGRDCPHYEDERDTGEEHFLVCGLGREVFVCEDCVPAPSDGEATKPGTDGRD